MSNIEHITTNRESTFQILVTKHGPLMKIEEVAKVFRKSTHAIRCTLNRDSQLSQALNDAKNRYGRRIYFRTEKIADLVDNGVRENS